MKYTLSNLQTDEGKSENMLVAIKKFLSIMAPEKKWLAYAFIAILASSGLTILAPIVTGHAVDTFFLARDYHGIALYSLYLFLIFSAALVSGFIQTRIMGAVGQRVLFTLRNQIFSKLQELPVDFFYQNKAGDLISRINNDTDKLNQFFSRSLMQFVGNIFIIIGAAIAMLVVNTKLGLASLGPALILLVFIQSTSNWIKHMNFLNLQTLGSLSAEIQESLTNFKVIIAFNRRDYFRDKFSEVNEANYKTSIWAGIANNTYVPVFGLASNLGTLIVITYGLYLIGNKDFTFGLLISYLAYVTRFYDPLRQMASLWSDLQTALAGWDRISEILSLETNLTIIPSEAKGDPRTVIEFNKVSFSYSNGKSVLSDINFAMRQGKTYALVGPTGGGKTTTASLIARLYDPTTGRIFLSGKDIRSYTSAERTAKIGFILQDPFLFSGTVKENILYGNDTYLNYSDAELETLLKEEGLENLLARFDGGLNTPVTTNSESISLGQKQLIAFMRAILRHPDLLVLDEATANIDTITEQLLDEILNLLPEKTTRVVIAHRLSTIENADEIFFVNGGTIKAAGSLKEAVAMLTEEGGKS
jgi:ATP-binding cassette subfamily B protein